MEASGNDSALQNWLAKLRSFFSYESMRHARWETFLFRAGIASCAWQTLAGPLSCKEQTEPHGIAYWLDLTFGGDPKIMAVLSPLAGVCLLLYVLRIAIPFTLLLPLVMSISMGTLLNSHGAINHTNQIVSLCLLVQWIASVWAFIRNRRGQLSPDALTDDDLAASWTRQTVMATYVVSAISKLIESCGLWFLDAHYFGLQITKASGMAKYGDTGPGHDVQWIAQLFLNHPMLAALLIGAALPLELLAFLGLLNRRTALLFGVSLYIFHSTVTEMMSLNFAFHKTLLLALFINPVWWVVRGFNWIMGSGRREEAQKPTLPIVSGDKN